MIYSKNAFPTRRVREGKDSFYLLESAGYLKTISPGCIALLPLGQRVMQKITSKIRSVCEEKNFTEIQLPILQKSELWEESGRAEKYASVLAKTSLGKKDYIINPTQEEAVLDLFRKSRFKTEDLPIKVFQIGERVRNEIRPSHGLIKSRTFTLADVYIVEKDDLSLRKSLVDIRLVMQEVLSWVGIPFERAENTNTAIGTDLYSYWTPSSSRQFEVSVCNACGASFRSKSMLFDCVCNSSSFHGVGGVEIGDTIRSGDLLSSRMGICPVDSSDFVHVGMAGIGVSRLLQLAAEYQCDKDGLCWSSNLAPFPLHIIFTEDRKQEAKLIYEILKTSGFEALYDVRDISLGKKLVDADLLGLPFRVVLGNKTPASKIEIKNRKTGLVSTINFIQLLDILKREEIENEK